MRSRYLVLALCSLLAGCANEKSSDPVAVPEKLDAAVSAIRPGDHRLIAGYTDGVALIWDMKTGKKERIVKIGPAKIAAISFSKDGSVVGFDCDDRIARIWRWNSAAPPLKIPHDTLIPAISVAADGKTVALVDNFRVFKLYDTTTGKVTKEFNRDAPISVNAGPLQISDDGKLLVGGTDTGTVFVWKLGDSTLRREMRGSPGSCTSLVISHSTKLVMIGGATGDIYIMGMTGKNALGAVQLNSSVVFTALSPSGVDLIASGLQTKVWSVTAMHTGWSRVLDGRVASYNCFSSDNGYLTTCLRSDVYLFDGHTFDLVNTYHR